jgi:hypothetical protein
VLTYELRLGITGHRNLRDELEVGHAIHRLLDRINDTLNHQHVTPLSWTVVSALASGADRLFAERVLEDRRGRLEVVTPFPVSEYIKDFDPGTDRGQFDRLLARASQLDQLAGDRESARDAAYLRAGEHVVDTCEIVVAVWDGRPSSGGGTGDVVEYAVRRERIVIWIDADSPDAPPRVVRSVAYDAGGRLAAGSWTDFPGTAKELSRGYHRQARYCLDPAVPPAIISDRLSLRRDTLLGAARAAGLDPNMLLPLLGEAVQQYVRADALAQYYQRRHNLAVGGVLYLAAAAVTVAVGQVLFFPDRPWLIVFEIVAMMLVFALWQWGRREAWHEKWLHDRYLAERLRAAIFTPLVGAQSKHAKPNDPLPFYRGPRHWLAQAAEVLTRSVPVVAIPFEPLRGFIVSQWLEDQRHHHAGGAVRKARSAHRRHLLGFGLFGVTFLMAGLHLAGVGHPHGMPGQDWLRIDLWISFLAIVLPAWAGAVHAATSQLELERLAQRSEQMARALDRLVHRAERARSIEELREVCRYAAELMADENHEWWVLLSFQRLRLHV